MTYRIGLLCIDRPQYFSDGRKDYTIASGICDACPILNECKELADEEEAGLPLSELSLYIGGETPQERFDRRHGRERPPRARGKVERFREGNWLCLGCGRPLRPIQWPVEEAPGTVTHKCLDRCWRCHNRLRKRRDKK